MSISKTLPWPISILLGLALISTACAPLSSSDSHPAETMAESPRNTVGTEPPVPLEEEMAEELTVSEPEETVAQEMEELQALGPWTEASTEPGRETGVEYDFPVTINKQVEFYLDFFQNKQRRTFSRWLARSGRYLPMIQSQLKEAGLPLDLAYLPMIESGYSLTAYSRSSAVGPWQFMKPTARHFGLTINQYVDERRDPVKSTRAAIKYLTYLYDDFDCWLLAVAAYNAGEGKIRWASRKAGSDNFWELSHHLHLETKRYVPKLMAAIIIARDPAKFGFDEVVYEAPLEFETVEVPPWTQLEAVAAACETDLETLRNLNRQLRQGMTPPKQAHYPLKVPKGKSAVVAQNLPRVRPILSTRYKTHTVQGRESLAQVCRQYNLNKLTLLRANNLRSTQLKAGQQLRIPHQVTRYELLSEERLARLRPAAASQENLVLHTIRPGETISKIAKEYQVPSRFIMAWNDLESIHRIRAGQQLALYLAEDESGSANSSGDSQVIEPKTFKLATAGPGRGKPGHRSSPQGHLDPPSPRQPTYYQVQGGDTLWEIARKFKLTTEQIKRWNQLEDNTIHPGAKLLLKLDEDIDA